ncbi:MAG: hypothetical protein O3C40_18800 [Planctomycetota bacterium]|nr:hypothetical protein [Planctomycetota bacterium]
MNSNPDASQHAHARRELWRTIQVKRIFSPIPICWEEVEEILPFLNRQDALRFVAGEVDDFNRRILYEELFRWHPALRPAETSPSQVSPAPAQQCIANTKWGKLALTTVCYVAFCVVPLLVLTLFFPAAIFLAYLVLVLLFFRAVYSRHLSARPRYSLATLLLAVAVYAGILAWNVRLDQLQRLAVAQIEGAGGSVSDPEGSNPISSYLLGITQQPIRSVSLSLHNGNRLEQLENLRWQPSWLTIQGRFYQDADIYMFYGQLQEQQLQKYRERTHLVLDLEVYPAVTKRGWWRLQRLEFPVSIPASLTVHLGSPSTHGGPVGAEVFSWMGHIDGLYNLDVDCFWMNDDDLHTLMTDSHFERLTLRHAHGITSDGLSALQPTHLETLAFHHCHNALLTDSSMIEISKIATLSTLEFDSEPVTNAHFRHLRGMRALQELTLRRTGITDEGLKELIGVPNLKSLTIVKADVTDSGLDSLSAFPAIESIGLFETKITASGLAKLKRALPNATITSDVAAIDT